MLYSITLQLIIHNSSQSPSYNETMRILVALIAVVVSACGVEPKPPSEPVNLVILSIDTLRPDHLGVYGYHHDTRPNLDRFARQCVVFDQAITVHVATGPAHGTILTGLYPGASREDKSAVIQSMMIMENPQAMISLMKQESDPDLKREMLQMLTIIDSEESRQYLFELLEKEG